QQALERWRLQKEAQIEQMLRRGEPLGAVAAALASPETAERIALMEAATSGSLSALEAAALSLRRAGRDTSLREGWGRLDAHAWSLAVVGPSPATNPTAAGERSSAESAAVAKELLVPLGLAHHGSS